jgi:5'-nucleotidase
MKVLLTNDDGIHAPGLRALRDAVDGLAEATIVAPVGAASGCSHQTTTDRPFRVVRLVEGSFSVEGTPADCVRVALHRFAPDVEYVLAGINNGGNLGIDVYHSGTVAAAREAAIHGLRGIAISQYHARPLTEEDWPRSVEWVKPLLADLLSRPWTPGTFWNVNLPNPDSVQGVPEVVYCPLEPAPLPLGFREEQDWFHYSGSYSQRQRRQGTDVEVCFGGRIAVTEITVMEASR